MGSRHSENKNGRFKGDEEHVRLKNSSFFSRGVTIYLSAIGVFGLLSSLFVEWRWPNGLVVTFLDGKFPTSHAFHEITYAISIFYEGAASFWRATALGSTLPGRAILAIIFFVGLGVISYVLCRKWAGKYTFAVSTAIFLILNIVLSLLLMILEAISGISA